MHLIHQVAFPTKAVHLGEVKMRGPNGVVVDVIRYRDKMQYDRRCCRAHPARRVHRRVQDPDELGKVIDFAERVEDEPGPPATGPRKTEG